MLGCDRKLEDSQHVIAIVTPMTGVKMFAFGPKVWFGWDETI